MLGEGGWCPLVAAGSSEEVIENLENDGNATSRVTDAGLTVRSQSARESPREDAWRVAHKTFYDCSWLFAQLCSGCSMSFALFEG